MVVINVYMRYIAPLLHNKNILDLPTFCKTLLYQRLKHLKSQRYFSHFCCAELLRTSSSVQTAQLIVPTKKDLAITD